MAKAQVTPDTAVDNPLTAALRARLMTPDQAAAPANNQGYQYSSASPAVQNAQPPAQSAPSQGAAAPSPFSPPTNTPYSGPALFGTGGQQVAGDTSVPGAGGSPFAQKYGIPQNADQGATIANRAIGVLPLGEVPLLGKVVSGLVERAPALGGAIDALKGGIGDLGSAISSKLGLGGTSALDNAAAWGQRGADLIGGAASKAAPAIDQALPDLGAAIRQRAGQAADGAGGLLRREATNTVDSAAQAARTAAETQAPPIAAMGSDLLKGVQGLPTAAKIGAGIVGAGALAGAGAKALPGALGSTPDAPNTQGQMTQPSIIDAYNASRGTAAPAADAPAPTGTQAAPTTPGGSSYNPAPVTPGGPAPRLGGTGPIAPVRAAPVTTQPIGGGPAAALPGALPGAGGLPQQGGGNNADLAGLTQQIGQQLQGIAAEIAKGPQSADVTGIFLSQSKAILDLIAQQEASLKDQAAKDGTTVDPATQYAIDQIKKQLDEQLKATREDLNRRGILESGITLDLEQKLRTGSLSDQARLMADRLSTIQKTLSDRLAQLGTAKVGTASTFGLAGANAQTAADAAEKKRIEDLRSQLITSQVGLRGQFQQSADQQANRDFTAEQNALARAAAIASQQATLAAQANDRAAQQQWEAQKVQLDQQFQQSLQDQRIAAGQYANTPGAAAQPSANTTDLATNNFIVQVEQAPSKDAALGAFNSALQDGTFANSGADPKRILDAINAKNWGGGFQLPFGLGQ